MLKRWIRLIIISLTFSLPAVHAKESHQIKWHEWSNSVFEQAARENRFVLMDLEAVWCHWCHVMDQETYGNPGVADLINQHFMAVKVDQDARPDLSNRYIEFGWPATIFFAADGTEIVKRRGYIPPERMQRLLQAIIDDPSPEKSGTSFEGLDFTRESSLPASLRAELERRHREYYDEKLGGLPILQKFLVRDNVEYDMWKAAKGDPLSEKRARQTLDAALGLLDPVWGGFYQYSTHSDWQHPHFEKIMPVQAGYLRIYALAYAQLRDPHYLNAAEAVVNYLNNFLTSPEGAFYVSQDADLIQGQHSGDYFALDDQQRRAKGIPRVDKHLYARENGWAIEALATLYEVTLNKQYLDRALRAARWVESNRTLPGGGFSHDKKDKAGPYLGDTLAMGRACLQLYRVTADREWLQKARDALTYMAANFMGATAGMLSAVADESPIKPVPLNDENVDFARFANLLYQYTGDNSSQQGIQHTLRFLTNEQVATKWITESGILLLDDELKQDPLHLTIVGSKKDDHARKLFRAAVLTPHWYKRVEWWDRAEGNLTNPDVQYPELSKAAAFVCTENRCSLPQFTPEDLATLIENLKRTDPS